MRFVRREKWGRVVYDFEVDEFEAHPLDVDYPSVITRPLSAGCLVTGRCNLKCESCYGNEESLPKVELDVDCWRTAFRQCAPGG